MVRALTFLLLLSLSLPFPAHAAPEEVRDEVPDEPVLPSEQPAEVPDEPAEVPAVGGSSPLYTEDGLLLSTPDEPVPARERASLPVSVYSSVTPNQSYALFADAVSSKIPWGDDYVFFRSDDSDYYLVHGDLNLERGRFSGSDCSYVRWFYPDRERGYLQQSGTGSLSLDAGSYIVLSNLGDYPTLSNSSVMLQVFVWVSCVSACVLVLSRMLSFLIRMGVRVDARN